MKKSVFEKISGLQYALILIVFNFLILRSTIQFWPQNIFISGGLALLVQIIPFIALYYRMKRLKFSVPYFLSYVAAAILSIFYGYDFSNSELMMEVTGGLIDQGRAFESLLMSLSGMLQLLYLFPINMIMIFRNAEKKKTVQRRVLSTEELKKVSTSNNKMVIWFVVITIVLMLLAVIAQRVFY